MPNPAAKIAHRKKRKIHHPRRRTPPGTMPGTLTADPHAPQSIIRVMAYGPHEIVEEELHSIPEIQQVRAFADTWPVTWVNVEGLGNVEIIEQLGKIFRLHQLALEDVVNAHQRPKIEEYPNYLFSVARSVGPLRAGEPLVMEQFSLFLGANFVLTFDERPGDCFEPVRERLRRKHGRLREAGADYLAYALLDTIVDRYFPLLEHYGEQLEDLEETIIRQPRHSVIATIHDIKRDLLSLRRAIWPQRETFNTLLRDHTALLTDETRLHLRDCYDHTVQLIDLIETYRELGSDLMEIYLSSVSNRTNETMRVLTVIATLFIPLTFIAGVYGMNFNAGTSPWNMPELGWYWGYPLVLVVMALVAAGQLVFFWRKGWIDIPGWRKKG